MLSIHLRRKAIKPALRGLYGSVNPWVQYVESEFAGFGFGVIALEPIPALTVITEYSGEHFREAPTYLVEQREGDYCLKFTKELSSKDQALKRKKYETVWIKGLTKPEVCMLSVCCMSVCLPCLIDCLTV